ncbi:hypothetical protein CASFOL_031391 [Castilleja foliolosa]|uniref:Uncharacterized protein n=1 Tax=Castilleja foliolosa TaxID=1961234 RepID=A0ABD3C5F6_9LAMI
MTAAALGGASAIIIMVVKGSDMIVFSLKPQVGNFFPTSRVKSEMGAESLGLIQKSKRASFRLISVSGFYITSHHNCPVLFMETSEIESNLLSIGEPMLHVTMCRSLCVVYIRILALFPDLEAARPRSRSGIQALCSLQIALEKTKNVLQHWADCSKLYLAITGDAVVMKFERTRRVLADSLTRVEDIVPQAIGSQIGWWSVGFDAAATAIEWWVCDEEAAAKAAAINADSGGPTMCGL